MIGGRVGTADDSQRGKLPLRYQARTTACCIPLASSQLVKGFLSIGTIDKCSAVIGVGD
jgi:hypothetical protein